MSLKRVYTLTPSEAEIIKNSIDDPNIFADYWFRQTGAKKGWTFDDNFVEEGKWQQTVHEAAQTDIVVIGGFGTGKTGGIGMSASVWAALTRGFKFLNVAEKAWQAKQMYDYIITTTSGTPFEKLIYERPRKPYPAIVIKYKIGNVLVESSLEFMSVDKDATGVLSWEGDWINIEEAGLLVNLEEIITSVGSRLRGSVAGRSRLGRLSLISNSWDNPYMWYLFDLAESDPEDYLSIVVSTKHNKNVTVSQFKKMLARIPKDEQEQFINGTRPEGHGTYFAKKCVYACEDQYQGELAQANSDEGKQGWAVYKVQGAGVSMYMEPPIRGRIYFLIGDPGAGKAPNRNAPVLIVWDVTDFPLKPARLVAFWWGDGNGQISPFVNRLIEFDKIYHPVLKACDATGPQKNTHELINLQHFTGLNVPASNLVIGMDFSGSHKMAYLIAARLFVEGGLLAWPKTIVGIRSQLTNYDPMKDRAGQPKIPQDIVSVFSMSAHMMRIYFNVDIDTLVSEVSDVVEQEDVGYRRRPSPDRERRSDSRAESIQYEEF